MNIKDLSNDDWRGQGQERYLKGKSFNFKQYYGEHDHCEYCSTKFSNYGDDLTEGYTDGYYWICSTCFEDFKDDLEVIN